MVTWAKPNSVTAILSPPPKRGSGINKLSSLTSCMYGFVKVDSKTFKVNPSKRGGMDGVFQGLARLFGGISRGQSPREIPVFFSGIFQILIFEEA